MASEKLLKVGIVRQDYRAVSVAIGLVIHPIADVLWMLDINNWLNTLHINIAFGCKVNKRKSINHDILKHFCRTKVINHKVAFSTTTRVFVVENFLLCC